MPLSPEVPRRLVRGGVGTKPGSPKAATPLAQLMRITASHYRRYVNANTLTIRQYPNGPKAYFPAHPRRSAARTFDDELTRNCTSSSTCGTPEHVRRAGYRNVSAVQKMAPQRSNRHEEQATQGAIDTGSNPEGHQPRRQPTDGVQPWKSSTDVTQGFTPGVRINDGGTSPGPPTEPNGPTTVKVSSVESPGSSSMVAVPTSRP